MSTLDAALALAAEGFHVFPVKPGAKTPAVKGWKDVATNELTRVKELWDAHPNCNIGIFTGRFMTDEALLVVDVDKKGGRDGNEELLRLELEGQELPLTREAETPTGGRHLFFRVGAPVRQGANVLGPGLDIRSRGGYVLGAGSAIEGKRYRWRGRADVSPAPEWLGTRLRAGPDLRDQQPADAPVQVDVPGAVSRARKYLLEDAPLAVEGERNDSGYRTAARIKDFGVPQAECLALMAEHWRCEPMLDAAELAHVVNSAYEFGQNPQGSIAPEAEFSPILATKLRIVEFKNLSAEKRGKPLIKGLLEWHSMSVMIGAPSAGKTLLAVDMCVHLASGRPWRGRKVQQCGVLYVAAENPGSVEARFLAAKSYHGLAPDLPIWVVTDPVRLIGAQHHGPDLVAALRGIAAACPFPLGIMVIDTLARVAARGDENSAKDMGELIERVDIIRAQCGVHAMVLHHLGKDESRGARGSSAILGATDTEITVKGGAARVTKQRDGESGVAFGFSIEQVELGHDEDGDAITSVVAAPAKVRAEDEFTPLRDDSQPAVALKILAVLLETAGDPAPAALGLGDDARVTTLEKWRKACSGQLASSANADRTAFKRALDLLRKGHMGEHAEMVWVKER